jgi:5-hydroxyisourate hydrolase
VTDADGRHRFAEGVLVAGVHRLRFDTGAWFGDRPAFYPEVVVTFTVTDPAAHHHVPLLLSPYAYSTYRGS